MADATWPPGLTDTDTLIDAGRGFPAAVTFVSDLRSVGNLSVSAISAMELIVGCTNKTEQRTIELFLNSLTIVHMDAFVSAQALDWMQAFRLSHGLLIADALIAATALQHDLTLFTKNGRHLQILPGLQIQRPY